MFMYIPTPAYLQRMREVRGDAPVLLHVGGQQLLPPLEPVGNLLCGVVVGGYFLGKLFMHQSINQSINTYTSPPKQNHESLLYLCKVRIGGGQPPVQDAQPLGKEFALQQGQEVEGREEVGPGEGPFEGLQVLLLLLF